jgi:LysM repeat protein
MDSYDTRKKARNNRARERQSAREQRRRETAMATPRGAAFQERDEVQPLPKPSVNSAQFNDLRQGVSLWLRDALWYIMHRPYFAQAALGIGVALFLVFTATHVFSGRIFPNVWVMGVHVGDLTVTEAQAAINDAWVNDYRIQLFVEGEARLDISPVELGLQIDAASAAEAARNVGMSGLPFGYGIEPTIELNYQTAQNYLLTMTEQINTLPYNAGYALENGQVVGLPGKNGRQMDITGTMNYLQEYLTDIAHAQRLDILTLPIAPDVIDPSPFLADVQALVNQPFALIGYDPFTNTSTGWSTSHEEFISWIEAGNSSLTVREPAVKAFIEALNKQIARDDPTLYIGTDEAIEQVNQAIADQNPNIYLRFNHYPEQYEVVAGDTGFRISRKKGIPFYLIQQANPNLDWEAPLYPGDVINLPTKDVTIPEPPIANKRIVVDLDNQMLVAFENGQEVFNWLISSGVYDAPTSPGIYQVLSHEEIAYGSSFSLCSENGSCGQWKMYWFMGMYQIGPGMMNGFHGAVELPNGTYLGGGNVGDPYTFGCVMSLDENAKKLYDWAEIGTVVEIVSSEYAPVSDLGRQVYNKTLVNNDL